MATRVISREPKDPQELYKEALENVSAYNSRLRYERRLRIPFIDAQTGIAMNNCHLWISKLERRPGQTPHYIYSYPARRWRKKKRLPPTERSIEVKTVEIEEQINDSVDAMETEGLPEECEPDHPREAVVMKEEEMRLGDSEGEEELQDDSGALSTDDEDFIVGKKRPISKGRPRKKTHQPSIFPETPVHHKTISQIPGLLHVRNITKEELARMDPEERKKPYVCEICGRRYKNGPGLKYHYTHYNHEQETGPTHHEEPTISHPSTPATSVPVESPKVPSPPPHQRGPGRPKKIPGSVTSPNNYCDFCLGDVYENKTTGFPEELLSCADCGRSGHPSCLQFTGKLTESVKKYKWQCIECKSCTLCGTSDNDDQLLFCDGCDRGYHMYCLKPPMQKPPEGHWTCALCENSTVPAPVPMPPHMMMKTEWH